MKVLLYDPAENAHGAFYIDRFLSVLAEADVVVAAPKTTIEALGARAIETVELPYGASGADFDRTLRQVQPERVVHLFADRDLPYLVRRRNVGIGVSILLFRPRLHYRSVFGDRLDLRERAVGALYELCVSLWRRRSDSRVVGTLDEFAAESWNKRSGAPALWLPEPPPHGGQLSGERREGVVLFGLMAPRKGLDRVVDAVEASEREIQITLAGSPRDHQRAWFERHLDRLRLASARVRVTTEIADEEIVPLLSQACCAVLPYPRHHGMSRVLIEAAAAGTPVVATNFGLLGKLVRSYGLGEVVDTSDPVALRDALHRLGETDRARDFAEALESFIGRYTDRAFSSAVRTLALDDR